MDYNTGQRIKIQDDGLLYMTTDFNTGQWITDYNTGQRFIIQDYRNTPGTGQQIIVQYRTTDCYT